MLDLLADLVRVVLVVRDALGAAADELDQCLRGRPGQRDDVSRGVGQPGGRLVTDLGDDGGGESARSSARSLNGVVVTPSTART